MKNKKNLEQFIKDSPEIMSYYHQLVYKNKSPESGTKIIDFQEQTIKLYQIEPYKFFEAYNDYIIGLCRQYDKNFKRGIYNNGT